MNFAIIGLGKIGIMHTSMVRNVPGARLAALIDREPKLGSPVDAYTACTVLDDVLDLVGKPMTVDQHEPTPGLLQKTLGQMAAARMANPVK